MRSINFFSDTFIFFIPFDVEMEGEGGKYLIFMCSNGVVLIFLHGFFLCIWKISMSSLMINGNRFFFEENCCFSHLLRIKIDFDRGCLE